MRRLRVVEAGSRRCLLPEVQAADRFLARLLGLIGRRRLECGAGLYLPRCRSIHTFFVRFPIDVVYLDGNRTIKKVVAGLKPWRLSWCRGADSVLEAAAGWVAQAGLTEGMQVDFEQVQETRR